VAITPDGSTIAAGGFTERLVGGTAIYLFDRESGALIKRIHDDLPNVTHFLTFSSDGRYLAAALGGGAGVRVFDRDKDWSEAVRDPYDGESYGATFAHDGRLATTSYGSAGSIRLYDSNFRLIAGPVKAPSGNFPAKIAFSPDGRWLAVGYAGVAAVDLFDGRSLNRVPGPNPTNLRAGSGGLAEVGWSHDGRTLLAAGSAIFDNDRMVLLAWDQAGRGKQRQFSYCAEDTARGLDSLPDGRIAVASMAPCFGLMSAKGEPIWSVPSPTADFIDSTDRLKVSADGKIVDFGLGDVAGTNLRFDTESLRLSDEVSDDGLTFAPNREGLPIDSWRDGDSPTLRGRLIPIGEYDIARSLAIAQDGKRFFLGSSYALAAFDEAGALKWRRWARNEAWAVNASKDGRIVVAAYGDGAIRWHRADDGTELLALQVLPNKTDWVLWTPEGFYEATPGAKDVLKWVVNHGPDSAATTLSVSAISALHRPDALKLVLDQLETARALGIADVAAARVDVQNATGSLKPPGAVLHVLAIGIDQFGDKAGSLHLDYAVDDARDVANVLLSQKSTPEKPTLYVDVRPVVLRDQTAGRKAILDAMDDLARTMQTGPVQDVAVILISTHGAMIKDDFYLAPYGFDITTPRGMQTTGISLNEFAKAVTALAGQGKVLLLVDACYAGAVGLDGSPTSLDASVVRNLVTKNTITVLSSSTKDEPSKELPGWTHGAFTQAFLDALGGGAHPDDQGRISMPELAKAMDKDLDTLTKGGQHLSPHVNFLSDVFVVSH
jgi:WD40 repeat protein